jgi:cytochrome P450
MYYFSGGVHMDPIIFPDPKTFKPERFLTPEGKFKPDERVIYFGIGKRKCAGELVGRAENYLFSTSIIQRFKLKNPLGKKAVDGYTPGLNMHILPTKAQFIPRF